MTAKTINYRGRTLSVIPVPGNSGNRYERYQAMQASAGDSQTAQYRATLFAQINARQIARDQQRTEQSEAAERATLLEMYAPHLPATPTLDQMEQIRADHGDVAAQIFLNNSGKRNMIEREREARDARIAELDAITDRLRAEQQQREAAEESRLLDTSPEPRAGSGVFQKPGNMPGGDPPEAA